MKLTKTELVNKLMEHRNGANCISMHVVVPVQMRKSPFPEIFKEETVVGMVQFCYRKNVEAQRVREGKPAEFKKGTSWHHVVFKPGFKLSPLSCHKKDGIPNYIRFRRFQQHNTKYFDIDGRDINYQDIKPYVKTPDREHNNQGLSNPIVFRTYEIDHIVSIKIDHQLYEMRQVA